MGKEPTLRTNAHNFLHGLCIPEHYASKCVKESNQDKKQCYSTNIYNNKQLIKKLKKIKIERFTPCNGQRAYRWALYPMKTASN